jgi:predicted HD superfamily hydrolase involved in NAD metabolism
MKFADFKHKVETLTDHSVVEVIEHICDELDEHELYDHMEHVANLASELALHYKLDEDEAYLTGFLHDVGRLIDSNEYLEILERYEIPITDQEKQVTDVLHGKVANLIAKDIFNVESEDISRGILYHTTLRKHPSEFEKIIFLADKMTWTYDDLIYRIEETVFQSLNVACFNALTWLMEHIEKKNGLVLDTTLEAYLYFKGSMLF